MSASSQSYLNSALPAATLTITEVEVAPSVALGKSNILLFAVAGAALGIVLGIGAAASLSLPQRIARAHTASAKTLSEPDHTQDGKVQPAEAQAHEAQSAIAQPGPKDLGSAAFDAAGLTGRLTTDWNDKATYQLAIEPANPAQQAGFSLAVAGSPKPLSVSLMVKRADPCVLADGLPLSKPVAERCSHEGRCDALKLYPEPVPACAVSCTLYASPAVAGGSVLGRSVKGPVTTVTL